MARSFVARLVAGASGTGKLLRSGSLVDAKLAASQTWNTRAPHLTTGTLEAWLGSADAKNTWARFCRRHLDAERSYLEKKLAYRLSIYERHSAGGDMPAEADTEKLKALAEFFTELDAGIERDQAALEQIRLYENADARRPVPDQLMLAILSKVKPASLDGMSPEALRKELATTVLNDLPRRLRDTKGMLLENEMQVARARG
jgi:hypothetical protein